jgi:hypothetical protein
MLLKDLLLFILCSEPVVTTFLLTQSYGSFKSIQIDVTDETVEFTWKIDFPSPVTVNLVFLIEFSVPMAHLGHPHVV